MITASMLYDFVRCPHRVTMVLYGDPARKDPVSTFVQLLWERGQLFEKEVVERLAVPFVNLRDMAEAEREQATLEAKLQSKLHASKYYEKNVRVVYKTESA